MALANKRILLGVSGGIAAYKSAELVRRLIDKGAEVRVVMTQGAQNFVTPLTFQALSGNPVHTELLDPEAEAGMGHIELARWADALVIAPASANLLARVCHGQADDLLTTLCLARRCPLLVAPAMNQAMWANPATQRNMSQLAALGIMQIGPAAGSQACGDVGLGRMSEVPEIIAAVSDALTPNTALAGKTVLLTAGPTREAIDPVRYISNHSSGKMGYALAQAAALAGADVILVSGPTALPVPPGVRRIDVDSALNMHTAVFEHIERCDIFIGAAAVADYRPDQVASTKIKKTGADNLAVTMVKNPDIISEVAGRTNKPFTVGFAAETNQVIEYAQDKLQRKGLDMIIANDVSRTDIGFNSDTNEVTVIWPTGQQALPQLDKAALAKQLIDLIAQQCTLLRC
ncbi:bifunctional phosphopantothenoylcysteine decarboxylase/phosphopantothenate--cysteine ligase CoaBC [Halioxenophilus aromaticivorans]|uniref:Coenzyme A biosynthesis bifunctional protein CoaBC n=1 Tax=Halioxenophilus aromaticivorans TaxID=1306992 RepID=A0AAV3TWV8_9ALTE